MCIRQMGSTNQRSILDSQVGGSHVDSFFVVLHLVFLVVNILSSNVIYNVIFSPCLQTT